MNITRDDLMPFCEPDRPDIAEPWSFEWRGARWTAATNGHVVFVIPGEIAPTRADAPNVVTLLANRSTTMLDDAVSLSDLRALAGPVVEDRPCDDPTHKDVRCKRCDGLVRGEVKTYACTCPECGDEHEADCDHIGTEHDGHQCKSCEGEGTIYAPLVYVRVYGVSLNRRYLAMVVRAARGETCAIRHTGGDHDAVWFDGDGWIAAIAPVGLIADAEFPAPKEVR